MRRVVRGGAQVLLVDLRVQLRAPGLRDSRRPGRSGGVDHETPHRLGEAGPRGVRVGDGDALEAVLAGDVDHAPVGQVGHREPGHALQRVLVVERAGEHPSGLGEQPLALLGLLEVGDVLDHVDRLRDAAVRRAQRPRLHARPARFARGARPVADDHRLGLLAAQGEPARQALDRERLAVLAEHLEAGRERRGRRRQQRRAIGIPERLPEEPHRGLVDVGEPAVGALDRDGVGHPGEDRLELAVRPLELAVEPCVLEVQPAAIGQLLGGGEVERTVAPARGSADQREVADDAAAAAQRHDHRGAEPERAEYLQVLGVLRDQLEHRVRYLGLQVRLAGPDHLRRADGRVRVQRVAAVVFARVLEQRRVVRLDRDAVDAAVVAQQLDEAPVGQPRHRDPCDHLQRLVEVERAGEQRARVRERVRAPARPLQLGDVLERQHRHRRQPGRDDRVRGSDERAGAAGRLPVDAKVREPLARGGAEVLRRLQVHRERAARDLVGGAVGEEDATGVGSDQQQRRRQQVEQRLVPAATGDPSKTARPPRWR